MDHNTNWLRLPYVSTFFRSHYLHPHPYQHTWMSQVPSGFLVMVVAFLAARPARKNHASRLRVCAGRGGVGHPSPWRLDTVLPPVAARPRPLPRPRPRPRPVPLPATETKQRPGRVEQAAKALRPLTRRLQNGAGSTELLPSGRTQRSYRTCRRLLLDAPRRLLDHRLLLLAALGSRGGPLGFSRRQLPGGTARLGLAPRAPLRTDITCSSGVVDFVRHAPFPTATPANLHRPPILRCALPASQRPTHHPTTLAGCVQHRGAAAGWWTSRGRTPAPRPVPRPRPRPPFAPRPALVDAFFLFWRMSSSRGLSMSMPDIT
jgi:hypothetical protein